MKATRTRTKKAVSDSYLKAMCRRASLRINRNTCIICGRCRHPDNLDCHHIVHRSHFLLRWDYRNTPPVCNDAQAWDGKYTCHDFADTKAGEEIIRKKIGRTWDYLMEMQLIMKKQYFMEHEITEDQYRRAMLLELKAVLGRDDL